MEFYLTDDKWKQGAMLNEYGGMYSIVSAKKGSDGNVNMQWCHASGKDKKPVEKAMPLKIMLGDKNQAIAVLTSMLKELGADIPHEPFCKTDDVMPDSDGYPVPDDDEPIPF